MKESTKEKLLTALRVFTLLIMLGMIVYFLFGVGDITVDRILNYTPENQVLAAAVIVLFYALKSVTIVFPVIVIQVASGVIFSPLIALAVNVLGMAVAMTVPYFIGRLEGGEQVSKLVSKHQNLEPLADMPKKNVWFASYIMRIVGFLPLDVVSMLCGSLNVNYFKYILGSSAGVFPGLVAVTIIGASIMDPTSPPFIISCCVTLSISAASIFIYRVVVKREKKRKEEDMKNEKKAE